MKKQTHSLQIRIMSMLLALVCILGLFPGAALAASPDTIKLEDCTYNGVHYDSPALGICYMRKALMQHASRLFFMLCTSAQITQRPTQPRDFWTVLLPMRSELRPQMRKTVRRNWRSPIL